jgi:hypothetical protein
MRLSELLENPGKYLTQNLTARVTLDLELSYDEAQIVRDEFVKDFSLRKMELVHQTTQATEDTFSHDVVFQSVDQIVIDGLLSVSRKGFNPDLLVDIYKALPNG